MSGDKKPLTGLQIVGLAIVFGVAAGLLLVAFAHR